MKPPGLQLALLLALPLGACSPAAPARPDVVLIVVDTLRADRLGVQGSGRPTSPRIDRLASEGALFTDATSQSSWTRPSMVSLFGGRYVTAYRDVPFEGAPTLAEVLQGAGYRTFGAVGNVLVSKAAGFGRGFDHFDDRENPTPRDIPGHRAELGRSGAQLVDDLIPAVADAIVAPSGEREPVLVYLHLMDPHYPYFEDAALESELPLEGGYSLDPWHTETYARGMGEQAVAPEEQQAALQRMARLRGQYDHEVRTTDRVIGRFLSELEALGVGENAVVALVADHGELLFDQPAPLPMRKPAPKAEEVTPQEFFYRNHGVLLDQGLVHTPFLLQGKGIPAGVRVETAVENIDLVPTLLELCDVGAPRELHGTSLVPWIRGEREGAVHDHVFSFCHQNRSVREVATGWKLTLPNASFAGVPGFEPSLHHLEEDPLERIDRFADEPEIVERLTRTLEDWAERYPIETTLHRARTQEERDALRALGYAESGPDDGLSDR